MQNNKNVGLSFFELVSQMYISHFILASGQLSDSVQSPTDEARGAPEILWSSRHTITSPSAKVKFAAKSNFVIQRTSRKIGVEHFLSLVQKFGTVLLSPSVPLL